MHPNPGRKAFGRALARPGLGHRAKELGHRLCRTNLGSWKKGPWLGQWNVRAEPAQTLAPAWHGVGGYDIIYCIQLNCECYVMIL